MDVPVERVSELSELELDALWKMREELLETAVRDISQAYQERDYKEVLDCIDEAEDQLFRFKELVKALERAAGLEPA